MSSANQYKLQLQKEQFEQNIQSVLYASDSEGNIFVFINGHFPVAQFSIKRMFPLQTSQFEFKIRELKSTAQCDTAIALVNVFAKND